MRSGFLFISTLLLLLLGCTPNPSDRIAVPELHSDFYSNALDRINEEIDSNPDDQKLIDQKLFYCEQLDWPTTCISALDAYKEIHGMTNQLVEQYIVYYQQHQRYQLLLDVIDRWGEKYDLESQFTEVYIDCLTRLDQSENASIELKEYLRYNQDLKSIAFASSQYLRLNDTVMSAYNLHKLYKMDPKNDLMWEYGQLLVSIGYDELGFKVMQGFVENNKENEEILLEYARLLAKSNRNGEARRILSPLMSKDTITYLMVDLFRKDLMWDSAAYVLDHRVSRDSSNRKPIWKLGRLYEDRGWLLTSIPYFEYLLDRNPNDTLAQQRIDLIQRKIAYLQRLKFEENKIPTIELEPKKLNINE